MNAMFQGVEVGDQVPTQAWHKCLEVRVGQHRAQLQLSAYSRGHFEHTSSSICDTQHPKGAVMFSLSYLAALAYTLAHILAK